MKKIIIAANLLFGTFLMHAQNVVQAEYFLDTDAGVGNNTLVNLMPSADGIFPLTVSTAGVVPGYHRLYIRTRDDNGHWSHTTRKTIEVISNNVIANITGGEYFFDTDPGYGAANAVSISTNDTLIAQDFSAAVNSLVPGHHKLYVRLRNIDGRWGLTARRNVDIIKDESAFVLGAEYFFNTDPGPGNALQATFATPMEDGSFHFNIPLDNIPTGAHTLYIRARDSVYSDWSLTAFETDSVVTSVQTGLWSDINTWSNKKIPDSNTVVIIHHPVTVDIDAFCKSLTPYRNAAGINVNPGKLLSITGHSGN